MPVVILGADLAAYLDAQLASLTLDTNLFVSRLPDAPDACVALLEGSGAQPVLNMGTLAKVDNPTVQVRVRDVSYPAGYAVVMAVFKALHGLSETELVSGGAVVKSAWAMQSPVHIGRDEKERHEWSLNLRVVWENANR